MKISGNKRTLLILKVSDNCLGHTKTAKRRYFYEERLEKHSISIEYRLKLLTHKYNGNAKRQKPE